MEYKYINVVCVSDREAFIYLPQIAFEHRTRPTHEESK